MVRIFGLLLLVFLGDSVPAQIKSSWYEEGDYLPTQRIELILENPLSVARDEVPVTIKREDLPFWNFGQREVVVVDPELQSRPEPTREEKLMFGGHLLRGEKNGLAIPCQLDDLNQDGVWDEIFFLVHFKPQQKKTIYLYLGYNNRGMYSHQTFAAIGDYGRHNVPMWESELVTWKLWYPTDVDIQVKRQKMLNGYYSIVNNMSGYHFSYDKGTDIMTVSNTFGAGGIGVFERGLSDSISRPRFSPFSNSGIMHDTRYVHEVISSGPVRSLVRVRIKNWNSGVGNYEVEQVYEAIKNKYYSLCRVEFPKWMPPGNEALYGVGIRKIMFQTDSVIGNNYVVSIAKNMPVIDPNPETIDRYRGKLEYAATALIVLDVEKPRYQFIKAFEGNHSFALPVQKSNMFHYAIAAGWHDAPDYKSANEFVQYVKNVSVELNNPPRLISAKLERSPSDKGTINYWAPPREPNSPQPINSNTSNKKK